MIKAYKVEIKPTEEQIQQIEQTLGNTRYLYNSYIAYNQKVYEETQEFVSGYDYSKILNNSADKPEWLSLSSSKANKQAIMEAEGAFKRFFKKQACFPRFKRKGYHKESYYLIGSSIRAERHKLFLPLLKWVRLKEYGRIPVSEKIKSVRVIREYGRYYVSCLVEYFKDERRAVGFKGIGLDLGLRYLAVSEYTRYENINKSREIRRLEKKKRKLERSLARKRESNVLSKSFYSEGEKKGCLKDLRYKKPLFDCSNYQKARQKLERVNARLSHIRENYRNQVISDIVKQKPSFIVIEDLNIRGMMKNRHLAPMLQKQGLSYFVASLKFACEKYGIELRQVSRWFPSSKLCSSCGVKNKDLQMEEYWECSQCGSSHQRDVNASINLAKAEEYKVLV